MTDNLADMGTAKQSGSYQGFDASKALDGNRNQDWNGRLDIGQPANIYNIVIYYRNDRKY